MVSEHSKNISIRYGLPNFIEEVASFAFLAHFQEISLLMVSIWRRQPFWAAILNLKVKTDPKYNEYHSIRSAKPELVKNDTS